LPPACRRVGGKLDLRRHGARPATAVHARQRAGELGPLAELEQRLRVPRRARCECGGAEVTARMSKCRSGFSHELVPLMSADSRKSSRLEPLLQNRGFL